MDGKRNLVEESGQAESSPKQMSSAIGGMEETVPGKGAVDDLPNKLAASEEYSVEEIPAEADGGNERMILDCNYLLQLFPEEVWILILDKIDPAELEIMSNASPYFRMLLQDKRVLFLFPKVWNVLAVQYHSKFRSDVSFNEARGIKWYSGILRLRLVCQSWCRAIDHLFQNKPSNYERYEDDRSNEFTNRVGHWINYSFNQARQTPQEFLQHFQGTHGNALVEGTTRNPFLNRRISITYDWRENMLEFPEFLAQIVQLMKTYGCHVWCCSIKFVRLPHSKLAYRIIRMSLELMPFLKVVSIDYHPPYSVNYISAADQTEELRSDIQSDSLPMLVKLKCLIAQRMPSLIFNEVIRTQGHVSMLKVGKCGLDLQSSAIYSASIPNLNKLALSLSEEVEIQNLGASLVTNWPLQKLYLNLNSFTNVNLGSVFALLENKWSDTLTQLTLNTLQVEATQIDWIFDQCRSSALNLPNLQRLELLMPGFFTLDFILPMRNNLEILDVTIAYAGDINGKGNQELIVAAERNSQIRFLQFAERPQESNIWELLPNLKQVTLNKADGMVTGGSKIKLWSRTRREWMNAVGL